MKNNVQGLSTAWIVGVVAIGMVGVAWVAAGGAWEAARVAARAAWSAEAAAGNEARVWELVAWAVAWAAAGMAAAGVGRRWQKNGGQNDSWEVLARAKCLAEHQEGKNEK